MQLWGAPALAKGLFHVRCISKIGIGTQLKICANNAIILNEARYNNVT